MHQKEKVLITSALPYVNNVPHMGNIIGCVLSADVFARFKRSQGHDVLYVCGTDEHGTTTEAKALEEGLTPREICDKYYAIHKEVYEWFNISFDIFGRTSADNHYKITQDIYKDLQANGYVLEQEVEQLYDEEKHTFLADRFVTGTCPYCDYKNARGDQCESCGKLLDPHQLKDPKSTLSGKPPVSRKSTHLYLDLAKLQPKLSDWFTMRSVAGKWTQNALTTTQAWLDKGLEPRAITRDLKWGVPVPGYENKVFYVWFDAPIGYISITDQLDGVRWQDWWQNDEVKLYQFMAKDNIPFHTILFPASLIGTGKRWTLLHHIDATEYLQWEDGKFSKSRGTGLFGDDAMRTGIPADVYRYYLLVNRPETSDATFTWTDLQDKLNNELLANLGNLVNRTLVFIKNFQEGKVAGSVLTERNANFLAWVHEEAKQATREFSLCQEKAALRRVMMISSKANQYYQEEAPWKSRKETPEVAQQTMFVLVNVIKDLAIMLEPFLPATSARIFAQLGMEPQTWTNLGVIVENQVLGTPEALFGKIEDKDLAAIKESIAKKVPEERAQLQIRVGRIVEVDRHPDAAKLYIEKVDFGGEMRTIVSGLVEHIPAEQLRGKLALFVTNLKAATLRGVASEGMILAAEGLVDGKETLEVLTCAADAGTYVVGDGSEDEITIDQFTQHTLEVVGKKVLLNSTPLMIGDTALGTATIVAGKIR